jgi:hypothetical protein
MSPRWGLTPRRTDRLTVGRNVTLTASLCVILGLVVDLPAFDLCNRCLPRSHASFLLPQSPGTEGARSVPQTSWCPSVH